MAGSSTRRRAVAGAARSLVLRGVNLAALGVHDGQDVRGVGGRVLGHGVEAADADERPIEQHRHRLRARQPHAQAGEGTGALADGDQFHVAPLVPARRGDDAVHQRHQQAALFHAMLERLVRQHGVVAASRRGADRAAALDSQDVHAGSSDSATWIARKRPRALLSVSSYSRSGTESATMPAPAWTMTSWPAKMSVRMAMQVSRLPRKST